MDRAVHSWVGSVGLVIIVANYGVLDAFYQDLFLVRGSRTAYGTL